MPCSTIPPVQIKASSPWFWAFTLLAVAIISGCDYPQAGYYALVGLNHTGEQATFHPFLVEEITDDSDMTTGFVLFLPKDQTLVEVPIINDQDTSKRSWNFGIATVDTQAGSLDFSFAHFNSKLHFLGEYQALTTLEPWPVSGIVNSDKRSSWLEFSGGLPYLHESLADVFSLELVQISQNEFETALGCPAGDAMRAAQAPVSLEVVEPAPIAKPKQPKKPTHPPKPPARGSGGRR